MYACTLTRKKKIYLNHFRGTLIFSEHPLHKIYGDKEAENTNRDDKNNNWRCLCTHVKDSSKAEQ
jgi:hypothetical protein